MILDLTTKSDGIYMILVKYYISDKGFNMSPHPVKIKIVLLLLLF